MGIKSALFGPSPVEEVITALESFKFESGIKESKFRDALLAHLVFELSVSPKSEAGLHGQGTKLDLYFEHRDEEFIITIKQGLSEQKVKTSSVKPWSLQQLFASLSTEVLSTSSSL